LLGHVRQLAAIRPDVGHLVGNDEMMRRIHGALHVVADNPAALPLVAIERASGSVREICLSSLAII